jgi:hypothetical protein
MVRPSRQHGKFLLGFAGDRIGGTLLGGAARQPEGIGDNSSWIEGLLLFTDPRPQQEAASHLN